ncbi:NAD-dependent epimerase/dehydratase family protein [Adhaeribacter rhizoryzae]|uniref:NAD-dependent epimerase/dehydratase family protein n=1 Tax=Adhaeribacter rhizoryzae TaxID=2607907 RepID=A0A5M6DG75_9BACT|nr:NAD-dependent epimerase/dehydratase family protein [Adhaeribacter rhizoryzae]KAA5546491.1 NAD-dependent epimerase/dehydratase family protein [Adhaeribacter rhizoryzae]
MKIRAIITGATGMVGEGVLHECLAHPHVEHVLVINRKPLGIAHPKLKEIIHTNFFDISAIEAQLHNYNACFFCLGVSSVGMAADEYYRLTYDLTMHVAQTLARLNPNMVFCYVSGAGTDSTELGRSRWARVKGKTENHLQQLPFKQTYLFRPAYIHPIRGLKNTKPYFAAFMWLYPILRRFLPQYVSTLQEVGRAMVNVVLKDYNKPVLEVKDINALAKA